jgi:hypothetical protein
MREKYEDFDRVSRHNPILSQMDQWDIVSDPFERHKIYRHKVPLIKSESDGKGVYLFVIDKPGLPPVAMHDMDRIRSFAFELRFLIDNEPVEMGTVGRLLKHLFNKEGFLNMPPEGEERFFLSHAMQNLERLPENAQEIPFRLKYPITDVPSSGAPPLPPPTDYTPPEPITMRGIIAVHSLRALRDAITLAARINNR